MNWKEKWDAEVSALKKQSDAVLRYGEDSGVVKDRKMSLTKRGIDV